MLDVAQGKVKVSPDLRYMPCIAVHDRAYGRSAQNISVDIALKKASEAAIRPSSSASSRICGRPMSRARLRSRLN
jgi:hypothetical protein